jgi:fatty-acyl-CoA synthase
MNLRHAKMFSLSRESNLIMAFVRRFVRDFQFVRTYVPLIAKITTAGPEKKVDYSDFLAASFRKRGDRPALIGDSGSMTWAELDDFANRTAHWALSEGLKRGDVVALLMANRPEYVAIWLGLSRVGVVTALLNTHLTGGRLAHCMREANVHHWIIGEELVDAAASALPELSGGMKLLVASGSEVAGIDLPVVLQSLPGAESFSDALEAQPGTNVDEAARAERRGKDGLFLIYTSGTTGLPKAAYVSHTKALSTGIAAWKLQGLDANDRVYCCLPLYHSAGGMMAVGGALLSGATFVIARKFSAKRFWSDCAQHDVTAIQYIGELCRYLLNSPAHPDERAHEIRVALGNGLRPEVWSPFQERFGIPRILEFYGATEGNFPLFNLEGRVGAIGQLPGFVRKGMGVEIVSYDVDQDELRRDVNGYCVPVSSGTSGELVVKISETARFEGYTNDEASEKKVLRGAFSEGDVFFRTGDLLRMDAEGFYYFVDRIGDTFRWKGENVATSEVAEVVSGVDGVREANIYGVEVPGTDGRAGMAALVTSEVFDLESFGRVVEEGLAFYARPLFVRILAEMEITGTFKHRKVDLAKEGFDPSRIADPLFFRDPEEGRYVPLDSMTYDRIVSGEIRV